MRYWFFELIYAVMYRAEISELLCETVDDVRKGKVNKKLTDSVFKCALSVRKLMFKTLAWVLRALNNNPRYHELKLFCARVCAIMCFRIPDFGRIIEKQLSGKKQQMRKYSSYEPPSQRIINYLDRVWGDFHLTLASHHGNNDKLKEQVSKMTWFCI